ncbi:MAG: sugar ABC transporter substrate-binding protein [Lachnospiraceae bacterium]
MKKIYAVILIMGMIIMNLAGCEERQNETRNAVIDVDEMTIGITFDTFVLERWIRDRDVFMNTAISLGATVDVQNANGDIDKQKEQIEKFIEQDKDAIVVVAVDCYQLTDTIAAAKSKGIIVVSYDRLIQEETTDLYITVENRMVGKAMALEIQTKLPDGGNVVMICGPEADTNSLDVEEGFKEIMEDSKWNIIYNDYVKSWTPENGTAAVTAAFESVAADDVDAVMCGNDGLAGYVIRALSEMQMAGTVIVVGQDADLEACQRVVEGTQSMTVYKPIEELAKTAAECTVKLIKGEEIDGLSATKSLVNGSSVPYYPLEPVAVTKDNMDSVIIDSGFHPREEVYLNLEEDN